MSTITPLITTDNGATSLVKINTNINNLNTDKLEKGAGVTNNIVLFGSGNVLADSGQALPSGVFVGTTSTQTLTNKTLTSPIINTPTVTSPNTTGTDTGTQTLSNKSLISPKIDTILDANGNKMLETGVTASAVNNIKIINSATGVSPQIISSGSDTNIDNIIKGKGTGNVILGNANIKFPNTDGASAQVLSTDGSGNLSFISTSVGVTSFGTGVDGTVLLDGTNTYAFLTKVGSVYTITSRDISPSSLTVNAGVTLKTNGYAVYSSNSINNAGTISNDGGAASGATHGNGAPGGTFTAGTDGVDTPIGSTNQVGTAGTAKTGLGSAGSAGGRSTFNPDGGAGGAITAETVLMKQILTTGNITAGVELTMTELYRLIASTNGFALSNSAGSGSGGTANNQVGGSSGGSGGVLLLATPSILNTGTIASRGGVGGVGATNGSDSGGGGGGGSGGIVCLIYKALTVGTITVAGGAGGASGGTGSSTAGVTGVTGKIYRVKVTDTIMA